MKTRLPIATLLALALVAGTTASDARSSAFTDDRTGTGTGTGGAARASAGAKGEMDTPASAASTGDGHALGMVSAVNEHEIAASRQAQGKNVSPDVLAYARRMEKEHSANQSKAQALGQPVASSEMQALKSKKAAERAALGQQSGDEYEDGYVAAMVKDHQEALQMLDTRLLPAASSDAVRAHLTETRQHVAMHLQEAQRLQASR